MSRIKLKASEINEYNTKLAKANEKFDKELKAVVKQIKALVNDKSVLYSELASANLNAYVSKIESNVCMSISASSLISQKAVDLYIQGIETADKAC